MTTASVFALERRADPTRTAPISRRLLADGRRRFGQVVVSVEEALVAGDVFGLLPGALVPAQAPGQRAFAFGSDEERIAAFLAWLEGEEDEILFETTLRPGIRRDGRSLWTDSFILAAYLRGISRARLELRRIGVEVPLISPVLVPLPGAVSERGIGLSFLVGSQIHLTRLRTVLERVVGDLREVVRATNAAFRRALFDLLPLRQVVNPASVPRRMATAFGGSVRDVGLPRLGALATTMVVLSHHEAMVAEIERVAPETLVGVEPEFSVVTAGDDRVCPICVELAAEGPYTLAEARGLIPAHVGCRCIIRPVRGSSDA